MTALRESVINTSDPHAGYLAYKDEIDAAIASTLEQSHYILGPIVERFEASFATFVGVEHAVGVSSGTDAIHLTLRGLGIGPGDEVITVSHGSVATVAAIEMSGAAPVLVDVEWPWLTLDAGRAAGAIGPRTRAIIAVHLYGQTADLDTLGSLCDRLGSRSSRTALRRTAPDGAAARSAPAASPRASAFIRRRTSAQLVMGEW